MGKVIKKIIRKVLTASETKASDEDRTLVVKISTKTPDRSRDVMEPKGAQIKNFMRNPVVAAFHNYRGPSIGKAEEIKVTDNGIVSKVKFLPRGIYPLADQLYEIYKEGFMNAWSVGFIPIESEELEEGGRHYKKWELLEFSAVLVPDNPEALTLLRSKGIDTEPIEEALDDIEKKRVIPFRATPKAPEDTPWNGPEEVREAEVKDLKIMCAWFDAEKPDVKASYKLPHHQAEGQHPVVWRGVAAAMAALLGARGGVQIPDSDRRGVYNHLKRHYAQFDKEAPDFRSYSGETKEVLVKYFGEDILAGLVDNIEVDEKEREITIKYADGKEKCFDSTVEFVKVSGALFRAHKQVLEGRVLDGESSKLVDEAVEKLKAGIDALEKLKEYRKKDNKSDGQKAEISLVEALKMADKVIGLALRDYKGAGRTGQ